MVVTFLIHNVMVADACKRASGFRFQSPTLTRDYDDYEVTQHDYTNAAITKEIYRMAEIFCIAYLI
jgi:hypothetical protein